MSPKHHFMVVLCVLVAGCALGGVESDVDSEALTQAEEASCHNALSPSEEKTALKLIDDICGDTWCEGDNNFAFERLTCRRGAAISPSGGTCTLTLRILPRDDGHHSYTRTCTTSGFVDFASLVATAQSGYQSLNWDYYLALTDCISALESGLHH